MTHIEVRQMLEELEVLADRVDTKGGVWELVGAVRRYKENFDRAEREAAIRKE